MSRKNKSTIKCYEKLLRKDKDFDFSYLLELERFKIKRMIKSFSEASVPHVGIEFTIRELKICISLIDIILGEDAPMKTYMENNYGPNGKVKMSVGDDHILNIERDPDCYKTPIQVNTNNYRRFGLKEKPNEILLMDYRRKKALKLYNSIRNRLFNWWW